MQVGPRDILTHEPLDIGKDRIATILRTIERGWRRALEMPGVESGTFEAELNVCLRDGMRSAVERRPGRPGPRMRVTLGPPTLSVPDVRVPDGHVDIAIDFPTLFEQTDDHEPHAMIECKRLAGNNSDLCREYVKQGIDRFVSGKYGGGHATNFMAGYVESGTVDLAARGINRYLANNSRHDELLGPGIGLEVDWVRSSRHPRSRSSEPVELHHAFLKFA